MDLEARVQEMEAKLLRSKAAKEGLITVKNSLFTRLKMATYALTSAMSSPSSSAAAEQLHGPLLTGERSVDQNCLPRELSLIPSRIPPFYTTRRSSPRPLDSYARSASVSYENILVKHLHTSVFSLHFHHQMYAWFELEICTSLMT